MIQTISNIREEVMQGVNRVIASERLPDLDFYLFSDSIYNNEYHAVWTTEDLTRILFIKIENVTNPESPVITSLVNNVNY